jgi:MazG family protein
MDLNEAGQAFREFIAVIKKLRTPGTGCPWDLEQDHRSLRPFLIEEAHEVLDAIDRGDDPAFREELGDLLLQVVLHAQVADDRGAFSITEVIRGIERKMVRRHPHVFQAVKVNGLAEVLKNWDQIKAAEAAEKGHDTSPADGMARLPEGLPALQRAQRLGEKAAKAGFDETSLVQLPEAFELLTQELHSASGPQGGKRLAEEQRARLEQGMGDVLFGLCQVARAIGVNAEDSLRACNKRFIARFQ